MTVSKFGTGVKIAPDYKHLPEDEEDKCWEKAEDQLVDKHPDRQCVSANWRLFSLERLPIEEGDSFKGVSRDDVRVVVCRDSGQRLVFRAKTTHHPVPTDNDYYCGRRVHFQDGFLGELSYLAPPPGVNWIERDKIKETFDELVAEKAEALADKREAELADLQRKLDILAQRKQESTALLTISKSEEELECLTYCDGLVEDIVDWICNTSNTPSRIMALGAAVPVIGTLIGRRVAGPTRSATHLYTLGVAPTGAGKQHPQTCAKLLMTAASAEQHIGSSEFTTQNALVNFVTRKPLSLCVMDEFGAFLKRINAKGASGWEAGTTKTMRELWGSSFQRYDAMEWANKDSVVVLSPAFAVLGFSTPDEFFESLAGSDLKNGFLNRFLYLSTEQDFFEYEDAELPLDVPEKIAEALKTLFFWRHGPMSVSNLLIPNYTGKADERGWADKSAKSLYVDFRKNVLHRISQDPDVKHFMGRSAEIAVRLATIRAAGRNIGNYDFTLDESDIKWGIDVAQVTGERLLDDARAQMVEEVLPHGAGVKRIIDEIKKHGPIKRRDLLRKLQRVIRGKEFDSIINTLTESQTIIAENVV